MKNPLTLGEFIIQQQLQQSSIDQETSALVSGELSQMLGALTLAAKVVHREINKAGLLDITGDVGTENVQGEQQQKLDVYANEKFKQALSICGCVAGLASEEDETFTSFMSEEDEDITSSDKRSKYVIAIDPVDGSSNIDVNIPVGTIFSIQKRVSPASSELQLTDFLQEGDRQVCAGYVIYGSSTMLVYSTGQGVHGFTLDPGMDEFYLSHENISFPGDGSIYSINEGNSAKFSEQVNAYISLCKSQHTRIGKPYSARYVGSFVADFHRNLLKGGIFVYPAYEGAAQGKLRILYECNPLAFIAEQAGGCASNGEQRVLDVQPESLHQRCPLFIGAKEMVDEALSCIYAT